MSDRARRVVGIWMVWAVILLAACSPPAVDPEEEDLGRPGFPRLGEYFHAHWGPANRIVVEYMAEEDGVYRLETHGLYTIRPDGSDLRLVVLNGEVGAPALEPRWSPDGERIAFSAGGKIFTVRHDGSNLRRLTHGGQPKYGASWSPDGTWIAYRVTTGPNTARGLWMVHSEIGSKRIFPSPQKRNAAWEAALPSAG